MKLFITVLVLSMLGGCDDPQSDHQQLIYRCTNAKVPSADRYRGGDHADTYDKALYECEKENPIVSKP